MTPNRLNILAGLDLEPALIDRFVTAFPEHNVIVKGSAEVMDHLSGADVLLAWGLPAERTAEATNLKWVQTISAGVDRVDHQALKERGILLTNSSGIHAINIAEHVLSLMFAFARRIPDHVTSQQQSVWNRSGQPAIPGAPPTFELHGQTLFVVGMGHIGESLAKKAKALDMKVVGVVRRDGKTRSPHVDEVINRTELQGRIGEADHVAICMPLTKDTLGMFDAAMLAAMKDGSFLYNIGRGSIVDQETLIAELSSGRLGGAGLDVTSPEPLPVDSPLWKLGNVIITPHVSGGSPKLWERGVDLWIENIRRYTAGEPLLNLVDLDAGY